MAGGIDGVNARTSEQVCVGQETYAVARFDARDVFAQFDQAVGLDQ